MKHNGAQKANREKICKYCYTQPNPFLSTLTTEIRYLTMTDIILLFSS